MSAGTEATTPTEQIEGSLQAAALVELAEDIEPIDGVELHPNIDAMVCGAIGCSQKFPLACLTIDRFGTRVACLWHTVNLLQRETRVFLRLDLDRHGPRLAEPLDDEDGDEG